MGCKKCWKISIDDYRQAALSKNMTYILDYIPKDTKTTVKGWCCNICKHIWSNQMSTIKNGNHGCPNCATFNKSEKLCRKILEEALGVNFSSTKPNFLKYITGKNLELDCYNEILNLALEYQGKQHYEWIKFFHPTIEKFNDQKDRDIWKRNKCKELKIDLIEVPYMHSHSNPNELKEFIYQEIKKVRPELVLA